MGSPGQQRRGRLSRALGVPNYATVLFYAKLFHMTAVIARYVTSFKEAGVA